MASHTSSPVPALAPQPQPQQGAVSGALTAGRAAFVHAAAPHLDSAVMRDYVRHGGQLQDPALRRWVMEAAAVGIVHLAPQRFGLQDRVGLLPDAQSAVDNINRNIRSLYDMRHHVEAQICLMSPTFNYGWRNDKKLLPSNVETRLKSVVDVQRIIIDTVCNPGTPDATPLSAVVQPGAVLAGITDTLVFNTLPTRVTRRIFQMLGLVPFRSSREAVSPATAVDAEDRARATASTRRLAERLVALHTKTNAASDEFVTTVQTAAGAANALVQRGACKSAWTAFYGAVLPPVAGASPLKVLWHQVMRWTPKEQSCMDTLRENTGFNTTVNKLVGDVNFCAMWPLEELRSKVAVELAALRGWRIAAATLAEPAMASSLDPPPSVQSAKVLRERVKQKVATQAELRLYINTRVAQKARREMAQLRAKKYAGLSADVIPSQWTAFVNDLKRQEEDTKDEERKRMLKQLNDNLWNRAEAWEALWSLVPQKQLPAETTADTLKVLTEHLHGNMAHKLFQGWYHPMVAQHLSAAVASKVQVWSMTNTTFAMVRTEVLQHSTKEERIVIARAAHRVRRAAVDDELEWAEGETVVRKVQRADGSEHDEVIMRWGRHHEGVSRVMAKWAPEASRLLFQWSVLRAVHHVASNNLHTHRLVAGVLAGVGNWVWLRYHEHEEPEVSISSDGHDPRRAPRCVSTVPVAACMTCDCSSLLFCLLGWQGFGAM